MCWHLFRKGDRYLPDSTENEMIFKLKIFKGDNCPLIPSSQVLTTWCSSSNNEHSIGSSRRGEGSAKELVIFSLFG